MSIVVDVKKDFGSFCLDVAFEAGAETLALLGASGCGKSMTLRCIAGIVKPDEGHIEVDGVTFFDSKQHINLTPQQRHVGLLFQSYALFPGMTVEQNIAAGLTHEKDRREKKRQVAEYIHKLHLDGLEKRLPAQLSGGQQQRVALARILVGKPRVLMLDEPFSALDAYLRWEMEQQTMTMIREFGGTTLLVSHNRDEVYRISDRVAVYNDGRIEMIGDKKTVFDAPSTYAAALLTGCKNITPAALEGEKLQVPGWGLELAAPAGDGRRVRYAGIRSHDMEAAEEPGENVFRYEVVRTIEDTFNFVLMVRPAGSEAGDLLRWEMPKEKYYALTDSQLVRLPKDKLLLLE